MLKKSRPYTKILSFLVALVMLLQLSSCALLGNGEISLEFRLTDEDYTEFTESAATLRQCAENGDAKYLKLLVHLNRFSNSFMYIDTQATVAYINYCKDIKSEKALSDYEYATAMRFDAAELYNETLRDILMLDNEVTEILFAEWSEEEKAELLSYDPGAEELLEKNELLAVEHRELDSDGEGWRDASDEIYREFFGNNKAVAEHFGYDNYYDYATEKIQLRDYSPEQRESFRAYVKKYVAPLYREVKSRVEEAFGAADEALLDEYRALVYCNYDENEWESDYIEDYIFTYDGDMFVSLLGMLYSDGVVIGDGENALDTAFTTYLTYYDAPIAFFGNGYRDMLTVVHENGHYAAFCNPGVFEESLDVHEMHSQGNEWMFVAYLDGIIDGELYDLLMLERLARGLSNVITATAVDEMEELIYKGDAQSISAAAEYVASTYGEIFADWQILDDYFRHVAIFSPVYYISYATSELVSIGLYTIAANDYAEGQEVYSSLVLQMESYNGFVEAIEFCDFLDPFSEETFEYISELFSEDPVDISDGSLTVYSASSEAFIIKGI